MVQGVRGAVVGCSGNCATTPVSLFAVSLTTFCICFCTLFFQAGQISELKSELMTLKTKVETADMSEHAACCCGVGFPCEMHEGRPTSKSCRGVAAYTTSSKSPDCFIEEVMEKVWGCYRDTKGQSLNRVRREASKRGRQRRQNRNAEDRTVIKWTPAWSQGEGLLVSGETVTVVTEGPYLIYSQVLYRSPTWSMGQVITKRLNGTDTKLLKCAKHMPTDNPLNSCYTAGVFFLESGAVLELWIARRSASFILNPYSTFFGMYSLW